jgi:rod shape-determining protein MreD
MAFLFLMLATYLAAALQTSLAPAIEVRHVMPDLFALVAIVWLLRPAGPRGFVAAGLVGFVYDLTSAAPLGIGFGLYSLAGYLICSLHGKLDGNRLLVQLPIVWLTTTIIALGEAAAARLFGDTTLAWTTLAVRAVGVGVYTTAVALPVLMVLGWLPRGSWRVARGA